MKNTDNFPLEVRRIASLYLECNDQTVKDWLVNKQPEHSQLEFKSIDSNGLSGDDRRNFAKLISAFANTSGGIIVWGITTAKDSSEEPDVASGIKPIVEPHKYVARLNQLTPDAHDPRTVDIEHKVIQIDVTEFQEWIDDPGKYRESDVGIILTLISTTDRDPIRALCGDNKYHRRSGDSTRIMEHRELQEAFRFQRPPNLVATVVKRNATYSQNNRSFTASFDLNLTNNGNSTAVAPYLRILMPDTDINHDHHQSHIRGTDFVCNRSDSEPIIRTNQSIVIHPMTTISMLEINVSVKAVLPATESLTSSNEALMRTWETIEDKEITVQIACADMPLVERVIIIPAEEIRALCQSADR